MELSKEEINKYSKKIILSRTRILAKHPFYGLLLMNMSFSLDDLFDTAWTNGKTITFNPTFLNELSDKEVDFVLMHELLHVVLFHCSRFNKKDVDHERANIACDIVVNSFILEENNEDLSFISLKGIGPLMHLAPNNKEGRIYTAEEIYEMIKTNPNKNKKKQFDSHESWSEEDEKELEAFWKEKVLDAASSLNYSSKGSNSVGKECLLANRLLNDLTKPQNNWREILNEFIQEEINDYSFSPPDRRFDESPFFLPDYNEKDFIVKKILFMIDTSSSMSDKAITTCYSEVKGAVDQFNGALEGYLGFFEGTIITPIPFCGLDELLKIKPKGGGGTNFKLIFEYVKNNMNDEEIKPSSIIILTDGYDTYPKENIIDIPTLWVITNEKITPPWGKVVRIKI